MNKSIFKYARILENDGVSVYLYWKVYPTYAKGNERVLTFNIYGGKESDYFYSLIIQFYNMKDELKEYSKLSFRGKMKRVISWYSDWEYTRMYCNDPSYFIQGAWYRLDKIDSAVFPFPKGFTDKGIWGARHGKDIYLTKHLLNVLDIYKFNSVEMVRAIDLELDNNRFLLED